MDDMIDKFGGFRFHSKTPLPPKFGERGGPLCWSNSSYPYPPWRLSTTFTLNSWDLPDKKIKKVEYWFDWDRDKKLLTYRIHDEGAFWSNGREADHWHLFPVESSTFYAKLEYKLRKVGCPSFLPDEAEIIEWFKEADRIDFEGYVALNMYTALRNASTSSRKA